MAVPTVVGVGGYLAAASAITPTWPASIQQGDVAYLAIETADQTVTIATPGNQTWTQIAASPVSVAGATRLTIFQCVVDADLPPSNPVSNDSGDHQDGAMIVLRGTHATTPIHQSATGTEASDTSVSAPAVTTTVPDCLIINFAGLDLPDSNLTNANAGNPTNASLTNLTERLDRTTNQGNGGGLWIVTGEKASAGGSGNTTCTLVNAAQKAFITLAIQPPAATTFERSAAIDGTGAIATVGAFFTVFARSAAVDAAGAVASSGEVVHVHARSTAVGATGAVTAAGQRDLLRAAAVGAAGSVQVVPQRDLQRSASVAATGAVASVPERDLHRQASISATGGVAASAVHVHVRAAAVAATGTVEASGQVEGQAQTHERSASVTATAAATVAFNRDLVRQAAVSATAGIATSGTFWTTVERSAAATATAAVSTTGQRDLVRQVSVDGAGAISTTGQKTVDRSVTFGAVAAISTTAEAAEWTYFAGDTFTYTVDGWTYDGTDDTSYEADEEFTYG